MTFLFNMWFWVLTRLWAKATYVVCLLVFGFSEMTHLQNELQCKLLEYFGWNIQVVNPTSLCILFVLRRTSLFSYQSSVIEYVGSRWYVLLYLEARQIMNPISCPHSKTRQLDSIMISIIFWIMNRYKFEIFLDPHNHSF